ncbi:1-phosphofructokinase [Spiroplasma sp. TIUS-1]|uniref:1-phosphofructokinase n=1 Tax=Spiroplasma sp. TIUS-1 TaxID=216963 RepID=UPI00139789A0|nr:1-phosphofructokinase [Spiroplasma sp. TIUS-1]QHX35946.1 1-phosphofructokinase [Spiroplasma sp. TIUS-1]
MIYTITLNPALDHIIETNGFNIGETNYYQKDYEVVGGKGINVSIILNNLNADVMSIGLLGKDNMHPFMDVFNSMKVQNNFLHFEGKTRTNFKIKNLTAKQETEINGLGCPIDEKLLNDLKQYLKSNLKEGDIVIAAGSIPNGVSTSVYKEIGEICNDSKVIYILDTSKQQMVEALESKPFLIKPNIEEICEILKKPYKKYSFDEVFEMIKELRKLGARNILLSKGKDGSIYFQENGSIYQAGIATGKLVNSVGSGDSMVAGFAYGLYKGLDIVNTLQYGAAAGGATAFTRWLASKNEIENLVTTIKVTKK